MVCAAVYLSLTPSGRSSVAFTQLRRLLRCPAEKSGKLRVSMPSWAVAWLTLRVAFILKETTFGTCGEEARCEGQGGPLNGRKHALSRMECRIVEGLDREGL